MRAALEEDEQGPGRSQVRVQLLPPPAAAPPGAVQLLRIGAEAGPAAGAGVVDALVMAVGPVDEALVPAPEFYENPQQSATLREMLRDWTLGEVRGAGACACPRLVRVQAIPLGRCGSE